MQSVVPLPAAKDFPLTSDALAVPQVMHGTSSKLFQLVLCTGIADRQPIVSRHSPYGMLVALLPGSPQLPVRHITTIPVLTLAY